MSSPCSFRRADAQDAAILSLLAREVCRQTYLTALANRQQFDDFTRVVFAPEQWTTQLQSPNSFHALAFVDELPVGFVAIAPAQPPACVAANDALELTKLYVLQTYHGTGVAQGLLRHGLQFVDEQDARLWLAVWSQNPRALAFYRQHGFVCCGELDIV